jgi:hypothetical protein
VEGKLRQNVSILTVYLASYILYERWGDKERHNGGGKRGEKKVWEMQVGSTGERECECEEKKK